MLAFIMVFTGMGIGSWGVDTAWASSIQYEVWVGETKCNIIEDKTSDDKYVLLPEGTTELRIKQINGFPDFIMKNTIKI